MNKPLIGGALALLIAPAYAQEAQRMTLDTAVRITDAYSAQRGFRPSRQTSMQPAFNLNFPVGKGTLTASYWGNLPLYNKGFPEHDAGISYTRTLLKGESATLEGMVGWQAYVDDFELWEEIQGKATVRTKHADASLFFAHDYTKAGHGRYYEISAGKAVGGSVPAYVSGALMINNHYAVQSTGITGVKVMAEVPVKRFKDGTSVSIDAKYFHSTNHHDRCFRSHPTVGLNIKKTWGLPRRR